MTRRPAVTLIEVLVTLFIMAIGMLALLVLFPLGAISMGQALKDDRCASTASMAENVAIAMNVRHDPLVVNGFAGTALPVYVDPYGAIQNLGPVGGVIPRVGVSFATTPALADRWFSLPDDLAFSASGSANTAPTGGVLDRGRRYSFAYLLTQPQPNPNQIVNLTVVVYSARPVTSLAPEQAYTAAPVGTNGLIVTWAGPQPTPNIRRGGWVLDTTGNFYRVTNIAEAGAGTMVLDVSPDLKTAVTGIIVLDNVAEVFDKGTSWQP